MKFNKNILLAVLMALFMMLPNVAKASEDKEENGIDVKEVLFHHLGDGYGWEVPFSHT